VLLRAHVQGARVGGVEVILAGARATAEDAAHGAARRALQAVVLQAVAALLALLRVELLVLVFEEDAARPAAPRRRALVAARVLLVASVQLVISPEVVLGVAGVGAAGHVAVVEAGEHAAVVHRLPVLLRVVLALRYAGYQAHTHNEKEKETERARARKRARAREIEQGRWHPFAHTHTHTERNREKQREAEKSREKQREADRERERERETTHTWNTQGCWHPITHTHTHTHTNTHTNTHSRTHTHRKTRIRHKRTWNTQGRWHPMAEQERRHGWAASQMCTTSSWFPCQWSRLAHMLTHAVTLQP
jgi:hypothetical protein